MNFTCFYSHCSFWLILTVTIFTLFLQSCRSTSLYEIEQTEDEVIINTQTYILRIQKEGFKYQFSPPNGDLIAPAHPISGLQIGKTDEELSDVFSTQLKRTEADFLEFEVQTKSGLISRVLLRPQLHTLKFEIIPKEEASYTLVCRTGNPGIAYGMGDHAALREGKWNLELENFERDPMAEDNGSHRMISNFVIFPKQRFAEVNINPGLKLVRITEQENAQGSREVGAIPAYYYFIGSSKEIYQAYLDIRQEEGYPIYKPKHEWFGVGWEAFGALAWNTNQQSVRENIDQYLDYGYPLSWMVLGSGFWPRGAGEFDEHGTPYTSESASEAAKKLQATTSFGMWDKELYPDPKGMIDHFHEQGLIFNIGLRIGFIPGGPFTQEGLDHDFFLKDGKEEAQLFSISFPRLPIYLLDTQNTQAVNWYVKQSGKWRAFGVDGFKEDLFHWPKHLPDDLIDPVNRVMMEQGVYIMGRNNYLGSPVDIHRYDDFNYNQSQDRGPINGLAYAFSGFPNVYPDIIGGTGLATGRFGKEPKEKLQKYIVRYAQFASLNPAMAFGFGPWKFDEETNKLCLAAAQLHHRLKPHIYSNAIKAFHTGFPYPMTPLPLLFPDDPQVFGLADTIRRNYTWMIGESLLAAPLYGDDYSHTFSRDIYLPKGAWMDYETGERFQGGQFLENFDIPIDKTPLFVGGSGFVVEQEDGHLVGRIYPINPKSETIFWDKDGETQSQIKVEVQDWDLLSVVKVGTDETVDVKKIRHAFQFELEPGQDYLITSISN